MHIDLDASQRAVLQLGDRESAIVLGVAGSGKTRVAIELIADRLASHGWQPGDVLALAGSRQAATRLRDRLAARVEGISLGPLARSAASLAFAVLTAEELGAGRQRPLLMTGAEHDHRIADLLAGHEESGTGPTWPDHLGPDVRAQQGFRTELRDVLARALELGMDADALAAADEGDGTWAAAAACMRELDAVLALEHRDRLVVDAASLLHVAAGAVRDGMRAPIPRLIVVDDAQELTLGTVRLLEAFAHRGAAIVALGDPDTATGMFRGADPSLLARLPSTLPGAWRRLELAHDWRHGLEVGAVLARVAGTIGAALGATHRGADHRGSAGTARAIQADTDAHEEAVIARLLRDRHVFDGVPWSDMGVIVRIQRLADRLARTLAQLEVPTVQQSTPATRKETVVADLMTMLGVATGRVDLDAEVAGRLLTSPLVGLDAVAVRRLRRALRHAAIVAGDEHPPPTAQLLARALAEPAELATIDQRAARVAMRLARSLRRAQDEVAGDEAAEGVLWGLWHRAGVADAWRETALGHGQDAAWANRRLDAVVALFDRAARFAEQRPDATAGEFHEEWLAADVDADSLAARAVTDAVAVGTPSAFVSRELDTVVVAGVQEGVWPNLKQRGSLLGAGRLTPPGAPAAEVADVLHDELRMFAHAASRASARLHVTAVASEDLMPSRLLAATATLEVDDEPFDASSLTLRGIVGTLRRRLAADREDADAASALARLAVERVPGADPTQWAGLAEATSTEPLGEPGEPTRVSPSAIEAFSTCALQWAVSRLSSDASGTPAAIGTIVHAAVEHAEPDAASLMAAIEARWSELGFQASWESLRELDAVRGMTERLEEYFATLRGSGWDVERNDHERRFLLELGDARLAGSIDWIERSDDAIRIVDLKTGRTSLSGPEIAANPQLRAYQLALARGAIDAEGLSSAGARIVRPKADPKKVVETQAPLSADELAAFEVLVIETARGMAAATFETSPSDHCRSSFFPVSCTIHAIQEVTE